MNHHGNSQPGLIELATAMEEIKTLKRALLIARDVIETRAPDMVLTLKMIDGVLQETE